MACWLGAGMRDCEREALASVHGCAQADREGGWQVWGVSANCECGWYESCLKARRSAMLR